MLFKGREYYLAAILIIVISIFLFMWSFEKRNMEIKENLKQEKLLCWR